MATQLNRPTLNPGANSPAPAEFGSRYFGDFYHHLMTASWPYLLFLIAAVFFVTNCLFALAYMLDGGVENARPGSFADVFFFSVQTMATIGYGKLVPATLIANILMSVEALTGLVSLALVTGLIFAKFSRPTARVRFTNNAVVSMRDGVPSVMFRMANVRGNQIVEAQIHVVFARQERTVEGEDVRRFYDLELMRYRNALFALSWTVIHPIGESSPFYGADLDALAAAKVSLVVSLTGLDETFSQTVHARHEYLFDDIIWGGRFVDILERAPSGQLAINYDRFDGVEPAPLTLPTPTGTDSEH
jgi:inward rectifier potassium channel